MTGCTWGSAHQPWKGTQLTLTHNGIQMLSFFCKQWHYTSLPLLLSNLNPGHLLWAQRDVCGYTHVHQLFSISPIDLGCKGSEERIASVCSMKWQIPFSHVLQSWSFYLYSAQLLEQYGWYVSGRALNYWMKNHLKELQIRKGNWIALFNPAHQFCSINMKTK